MASLSAFNEMLVRFGDQLEFVYDKEPALPLYNMHLKGLVNDPKKQRQPLEMFQQHVSPHTQRIMAKDETLISEVPDLLGGIDLHKLYHSQQTTEKTKAAIWTYLGNLTLMASIITALPPDVMHQLEDTAGKIASSGKAEQLQGMLGGMDMGSMLSAFGGLQSMFGGLGQ